jgi:uncharacterized membrane protein
MRGSLWRCGPAPRADTVRNMRTFRRKTSLALAAAFAGSAGVHLVRPQSFESVMPRAIPQAHYTKLIYASGVAELICAIGLFRRTRWAAPASAAVLAAIFPANVQMALDSGSGRNQGLADNRVLAWARLPLQAVMMWAALGVRPESDAPRS